MTNNLQERYEECKKIRLLRRRGVHVNVNEYAHKTFELLTEYHELLEFLWNKIYILHKTQPNGLRDDLVVDLTKAWKAANEWKIGETR